MSRCVRLLIESTRCRDVAAAPAATVATRARWRVGSTDIGIGSSKSKKLLLAERVGEGVMGKTGDEGTRTGKV